jgi:hypothetical protein
LTTSAETTKFRGVGENTTKENRMSRQTVPNPETASHTPTEPAHTADDSHSAPTCEHSATVGYNPNGCSWCGTHR